MKNEFLSRKERIIISTIDLISENGIKGLSIKEIAKRENVTEASLYKHFKSKDQILIEVLEYYSKYDISIARTVENNRENEKSKIFNYFKLYSEYYDSYPALTSIIESYNVLIYEENLKFRIKEVVEQRTQVIKKLIEEGQKNKNIRENIKSENLTNILLGSFDRLIFIWRLSKFEFSLKEKTIDIISDILSCC